MKKNKHNGFLLAEAFIVSTFVLGVLIFMYVQVKGIINNYNKSFSYNTIPDIYITKEIDKYFRYIYSDVSDDLESNGYIDITVYDEMMSNLKNSANIKQIIISLPSISWNIGSAGVDNKFKDYISWLKRNNSKDCDYIIITEFNDDTYASLRM